MGVGNSSGGGIHAGISFCSGAAGDCYVPPTKHGSDLSPRSIDNLVDKRFVLALVPFQIHEVSLCIAS